jgi:glycine betaine/proline transport system substrate-binding protein
MKNTFISRRTALAMLAATAASTLAACARPAPAPAAPAPAAESKPTEAPKAEAPAVAKPVIKLAENPWTGSSVNVYVAKEILETQLGYKVEIVTIDEKNQWPALAKGDLSASLEIWPSGHGDAMKQYMQDQKVVDDIGKLGVVGKIGWFVPKYVVDANPDLATIEGYKKPENAALFKTAETGDAGQFLAGDPSWVQFDEAIIKNLGLNFKVVKGGSEQAVLAALDTAYSQKKPIVFYLWTPHSIFNKFELVNVKLPAPTPECEANRTAAPDKVNCDYAEDVLLKVASAKLKTEAPEAHAMLSKMSYSDKDQIAMIAAVEVDKLSPADAAKKWVAANEAVWKAWLAK